jgi:hypothetical protein
MFIVCAPACAASHFEADATRHFSEIATALIVALAIHSTADDLAFGNPRRNTRDRRDKVVAVVSPVHT